MAVIVYTSPGCPNCVDLKRWLVEHAISWQERDLSQPGVAAQAKADYGVRVAPITIWQDVVLYGPFEEQRKRLNDLLTHVV